MRTTRWIVLLCIALSSAVSFGGAVTCQDWVIAKPGITCSVVLPTCADPNAFLEGSHPLCDTSASVPVPDGLGSFFAHRVDLGRCRQVFLTNGLEEESVARSCDEVNQFVSALLFDEYTGRLFVSITNPDGASLVRFDGFPAKDSEFSNVSTRGYVGIGDEVMIGGFILEGTEPKQVLVRVLGPTIGQPPFNVQGVLENPTMTLTTVTGMPIASNDDWMTSTDAAAIAGTGLAPPDVVEPAILVSLDPLQAAQYTFIVSGVGGTTGVAIVEAYAVATGAAPKLIKRVTARVSSRTR